MCRTTTIVYHADIRKVRYRAGSPQNWKARHNFGRFATPIIGKFTTILEWITKAMKMKIIQRVIDVRLQFQFQQNNIVFISILTFLCLADDKYLPCDVLT